MEPDARFCGICGAPATAFEQPAPAPAAAPVYVASPPPPPPPQNYYQQPNAYQPPQNYQPNPPPPPQQPTYQAPVFTPQPAAYQPAPPPSGGPETVLGVILLKKPKSLGRFDSWTAVVTSQRMIFALMTAQMVSDAAMQARAHAKAEGKGFMGQWQDQLKATFGYTQRYLTMDPNATLAETPGNTAVYNSSISEIKLHLKNINRGSSNVQPHEFELEVLSSQGTFVFRMEEHGQFVDLLKDVYGERVKMPFGYFSSHGARIKLF